MSCADPIGTVIVHSKRMDDQGGQLTSASRHSLSDGKPPPSTSSTSSDSPEITQEKVDKDAKSFPAHLTVPPPPSSLPSPSISHLPLPSPTLLPTPYTSSLLPFCPQLFDPQSPSIQQSILSLILQYLASSSLPSSYQTLADESSLLSLSSSSSASRFRRLKKSILDGDFPSAERLAAKLSLPPPLLYSLHCQHYLELIEKGEYQKAYAVLQRKVKPLEGCKGSEKEFGDLCYLLTCRTVGEAESFRGWGVGEGRERLVERMEKGSKWETVASAAPFFPSTSSSSPPPSPPPPPPPPPNRLITLLQQACAYQLSTNRYLPFHPPLITSLLSDYRVESIPNAPLRVYRGHSEGVRAVGWIGEEGRWIVSGGGDGEVRLWGEGGGKKWRGHTGRVWQIVSDRLGRCVLSASADSTVRLWEVGAEGVSHPLRAHKGDVYTVAMHPAGSHCASGGVDHQLVLWDLQSTSPLRSFPLASPIISAAFSPFGNLLLSSTASHSITFYDLLSYLPVLSLQSPLAAVSSLCPSADGLYCLAAYRDSTLRLLDMRMGRVVKKYRGAGNGERSWLRAGWGAAGKYVIAGGEEGGICIWEKEGGGIVQRLEGHAGCVFDVAWNERQSLLVSGGEDDTVRTWEFDPSRPYWKGEEEE